MFSGKVAVVTGSTSGIGLGIATALARKGADIVLNGFGDAAEIERIRSRLDAEFGVRVAHDSADLSRGEAVRGMIDHAVAKMGRIDILVNNAAAARGNDRVPVVQLEEAEWRKVIEVNLTGTFLVTKTVAGALIEQGEGGRIVNISSIAGREGIPTFAAYGTTKAGIILFTRVLAQELAPHGINVNCVCPGLVGTYRMQDVTQGPIRDAVMRTIPLGREGQPEEIGELVAFLCGPDASYVHGQAINIDGGRVMQ